mmetsp:Transcript_1843/g.3952  ORF Transcript_1843/g.3952 Transcript_1843/m.3952 type:complete len:205 (-) Transcript_1843:372-986(-)
MSTNKRPDPGRNAARSRHGERSPIVGIRVLKPKRRARTVEKHGETKKDGNHRQIARRNQQGRRTIHQPRDRRACSRCSLRRRSSHAGYGVFHLPESVFGIAHRTHRHLCYQSRNNYHPRDGPARYQSTPRSTPRCIGSHVDCSHAALLGPRNDFDLPDSCQDRKPKSERGCLPSVGSDRQKGQLAIRNPALDTGPVGGGNPGTQ